MIFINSLGCLFPYEFIRGSYYVLDEAIDRFALVLRRVQ